MGGVVLIALLDDGSFLDSRRLTPTEVQWFVSC